MSRCDVCGGDVSQAAEDDLVFMFDRYWHREHFCCTICFCSLLTAEPVLDDAKLYCQAHYVKKRYRTCAGCLDVITGQYFFELDKYWHSTVRV